MSGPAYVNDSEQATGDPTRKRSHVEDDGNAEGTPRANLAAAAIGDAKAATAIAAANTDDAPAAPAAAPDNIETPIIIDDDDLIMLDPASITVQTSSPAATTRASKNATAPQRNGAAITAYENLRPRLSRVAKSKPTNYSGTLNLSRILENAESTPLPGTDGVDV